MVRLTATSKTPCHIFFHTPSTTVPSRKQHIVSQLLGSYRQVDQLRNSIVRVQLHIRRCRFVAKFELEDLGITVEDAAVRQALEKQLILGEKRLLPEAYMKQLNRIESGARYALKERSFRTELGAFVPYTTYAQCKAEMETFKQQYFDLRDEIIAQYHTLKRQTLQEYDVIARDAYQRIASTRPDLLQESQEEFVAAYCNRIAAQIPTRERIRTTFGFTCVPFDEFIQFSASQESAAGSLDSSTIHEARHQAREHEWRKEAIERDLRLQAQERLSMLDTFCTTLVSQLRSQTYDAMCNVLTTLQRRSGESLAAQSVKQLKNLLERVKGLNFYGDPEVDRMMQQVQEIVDLSPEARKRSVRDIQEKLRQIATVTRASLLDLEEEPRSARELAIPDYPTETTVRQARTALGLDIDPALFAQLSEMRAERRANGSLATASLWDGTDLAAWENLSRAARQG